jgi:hypothetical protein
MGQRGFWDEEKRIHRLQQKKTTLATLSETIPWEVLGHCWSWVTAMNARVMPAERGLIRSSSSRCWYCSSCSTSA